MHRYRGLPAATLLPQLFLGFGWLHAATAHGIDGSWWSGDYIRRFIATETELSVGIYDPFLHGVVERLPGLTAFIVLIIELVVGVMLLLNYRPIRGLVAGGFLNLHFMLAGAVNPSTFYLVIALVIALWHMERSISLARSLRWARVASVSSAAGALILLPYISTVAPENAIDDPALVLIFLGMLFTAAAWWTHQRIVLSSQTFEQLGL